MRAGAMRPPGPALHHHHHHHASFSAHPLAWMAGCPQPVPHLLAHSRRPAHFCACSSSASSSSNSSSISSDASSSSSSSSNGANGSRAHTDVQPATSTPPRPADVAAASEAERRRLWMAAIKPPMYSVGCVPVLVAAAAVFLQTGVLPVQRTLGFLVAAICVIAWLNLSNDAFDADTGVDATKPESLVNLTGSRAAVLAGSIACLALGLSLLGALLLAAPGGGGRVAGAMLAASIACGYVYQGPPFRLSYKGLGEPLCFLAFGPSATPAFYLALLPGPAAAATALPTAAAAAATLPAALAAAAGAAAAAARAALATVPGAVWGLSGLVGATTTVILFTSHFHQIRGDRAAGKMSPLVRLGVDTGVRVLGAAVAAVYAAAGGLAAAGQLPAAALAAVVLVSARPAADLLRFAGANAATPAKLALLKRFACVWHMAVGASLSAGLVAARALAARTPGM